MLGWHGYLMYEKVRVDNSFVHHYVKNNLLKTWLEYCRRIDTKRPLWLSPPPKKILKLRINNIEGREITNQDCTARVDGKIELKDQQNFPVKIDWFQYVQIRDLFEKDNGNFGFRTKNLKLEQILLRSSKKFISNFYKLLLL